MNFSQILRKFSNIRNIFVTHVVIPVQGGDTPIYSVLQSLSLVKMKVKRQPPKIVDSQVKLPLGWTQESTSSFT